MPVDARDAPFDKLRAAVIANGESGLLLIGRAFRLLLARPCLAFPEVRAQRLRQPAFAFHIGGGGRFAHDNRHAREIGMASSLAP